MKTIITKSDLQTTGTDQIGAKAFNLLTLQSQGYNIPNLFAVPDSLFKNYLSENDLSATAGKVIERIKEIQFQKSFIADLERNTSPDGFYAVRSSAIAEDSQEHSFAGQLDTFLYITQTQLPEYIKKVWLSYFSEHAIEYRRHNKLLNEIPKIAVLIQEMVHSEVAGVAFNMNPVNGSRKEVLISAVYGLGEGLVSGELDADMFTVTAQGIEATIAAKTRALFFNERKRRPVLSTVDKEKQNVACLTGEQVKHIAAVTKRISQFYGKPQDIEWTIADDELFILQSRPITTLGTIADREQQQRIWDNSNIIESYPGVTTPLTFSFVKDVYTHVYRQFCAIMGVEPQVIRANHSIFEMLGFIKGRIYYNLLNWYKVLSLLPGYAINASFMEQMMGVSEKIDYRDTLIKSKKNKYLRLIKLLFRLIVRFVTLKRQVIKFHALIDETLKHYSYDKLKTRNPDQLVACYHALEERLLKRWHAPLVNDFFAMIFFGLLKKSLQKLGLDTGEALHNDLISAEGGIISVAPIRSLQNLSNLILASEKLRHLFQLEDNSGILKGMEQFPDFSASFYAHVHHFGDRVAGELKLESVTAKHEPRIIIRFLKSYIQCGVVNLDQVEKSEQQKRILAEEIVKKRLRRKPLRKSLFNFILAKTRLTIRNRENLRFERTRVFAVVRDIFRVIGAAFYSESIIADPHDIFYLTKEEIFRFISGNATDENVQQVIDMRKKNFEAYHRENLPDRFATWGPIYHANSLHPTQHVESSGDGALQGIGCSPGVVTGKVVVLTDPSQADGLQGNILVAEKTDPGWAPLFPLAKGLLVQRGSLLSHSAIVAREMRIPAIVSIPQLLAKLKTGDTVRFDGSTGQIEIVE